MAQETTTVSLRATPAYKNAFRSVAMRQKREMADMVREALDAKFGAEIDEALSFFAETDARTHQSNREG